MNLEDKVTRFFAILVVWSIVFGLSAIALGLIVRGALSVWSFMM